MAADNIDKAARQLGDLPDGGTFATGDHMTSVYRPIGDYALLGDGRTAALVARDGSIDWLPWPDFDSPTLFAALLDARRGGRFAVEGDGVATRRYLPESNVLETSFDGVDGRLTVTDLLSTGARGLLRILDAAEGRPTVHVACTPRPGYGSGAPRLVGADERRIDLHDPTCDALAARRRARSSSTTGASTRAGR